MFEAAVLVPHPAAVLCLTWALLALHLAELQLLVSAAVLVEKLVVLQLLQVQWILGAASVQPLRQSQPRAHQN